MNYIKHLPINDTPEIFGLHDNANITFAQNETFSLLNGILKLQPKSAVGAGKSREEVSKANDVGTSSQENTLQVTDELSKQLIIVWCEVSAA